MAEDELKGRLPDKDWKKYSGTLPAYMRSGEGYEEVYIGRDLAGPPAPTWRLYALTAGLSGVTLFHNEIFSLNPIVGVTILTTLSVDMAIKGKLVNKLFSLLEVKKRIINPKL